MLQLAVVIVAAHVIVLLYVSVCVACWNVISHLCLMQQLVFFKVVSLTNYLVMVMVCGVVQSK